MSRAPVFLSPDPDIARASAPRGVSEEEIVRQFGDRVRLFAAHRLGDAAAADDVAQETLRRVVEALRANRISDPNALPGFVFQTARNICMHWVRSVAREQSALARYGREAGDVHPGDALAALVSAERARDVRAALARLPADDQELLAMFFHEDLDTDAIATRLGITAMAVRVRKHRALRRLAAVLGPEAGNDSGAAGTTT